MGCTSSMMKVGRRGTKGTIDSLENADGEMANVKKRYGHPAYYKTDGFEIGLRVKVKMQYQSFFVGTARKDNQKVTIKEHHTAHCNEKDITEEIALLAKLNHTSIPKLAEIFITNISVFMVTDFVDSMRLKHYVDIKNHTTKFTEQDARKIMKCITSAVSYCHSCDVIVRNLTADNIMIKSTGKDIYEVKIADFSLAVPNGSLKVLCDHVLFEWDSVPYMAPEALLGHPYSFPMDVWSLGVLMYSMLSGELPFHSDDDKELLEKIKRASFDFPSSIPAWADVDSVKVKQLISEILVPMPTDRPTSKVLTKHPWLTIG